MPGVKSGVNDLYTWCINNGDRGNQLISEWVGTDEFGNLVKLESIASQSNKKVQWKCSEGHSWLTTVQKRTVLKSNCPYCSGNKLTIRKNDLKTWSIENNKEYLISEFTGFDDTDNPVDISEVSRASHQRVKWKHNVNGDVHIWTAAISDRTSKNSGCPYCNRKTLIKGKNDLLTWCKENTDLGDILIEQWVGLDEFGNSVNMDEISRGNSSTKVVWLCDCGRFWLSTPLSRISHRSNKCPACSRNNGSNKKLETLLKNSYSLHDWCINNGEFGKLLIDQFVGIDEANEIVDINKVTFASHRKVAWSHSTNTKDKHTWIASIHNRVFLKSLCPICNNRGTSLNEQIIYRSIKEFIPNTLNRYKYKGYEFDIAIPDRNICIEYNGDYYHIGREVRDFKKLELCKSDNIELIVIHDNRACKAIDEIWERDYILANIPNKRIYEVVKHIFNMLELDFDKLNRSKVSIESIKYMNHFGEEETLNVT